MRYVHIVILDNLTKRECSVGTKLFIVYFEVDTIRWTKEMITMCTQWRDNAVYVLCFHTKIEMITICFNEETVYVLSACSFIVDHIKRSNIVVFHNEKIMWYNVHTVKCSVGETKPQLMKYIIIFILILNLHKSFKINHILSKRS